MPIFPYLLILQLIVGLYFNINTLLVLRTFRSHCSDCCVVGYWTKMQTHNQSFSVTIKAGYKLQSN